jgi:hypothetical protein
MLSLGRSARCVLHRQLAVSAHAQHALLLPRNFLSTGPVLRFDADVESVSLFAKSKKYFVDVKRNAGGHYLKISELSKAGPLFNYKNPYHFYRDPAFILSCRFRTLCSPESPPPLKCENNLKR